MVALRNYIHTLNPIKDETWNEVCPLFTECSLKKGEVFVREGQLAEQIAFLSKGVARSFYRTNEGAEYNKHFFIAPVIIGGYASLITGLPSQLAQDALTDCEIAVANYKAFSKLYDCFPDLERAARRIAELYFVSKEKRELEIVLMGAEERYTRFQQQFPGLEQLIPQYHVASYLGISATQLSRIRKKMTTR